MTNGLTTAEIRKVRNEARAMTLDEIRAAYLGAMRLYATAQSFEDEMRGHYLASEYAEIFQARRAAMS